VVGCQVLMISMLALLVGASDADGDALVVSNLSSSSGTLTPTEGGNWMFTREQGMLGPVTLSYRISDGSTSIVQTAHFSVVEAPPIIGAAGDDNLLGTDCADSVDGGAGDDNIDARGGNDTIFGGDGNDHIIAGSGNDIVYAGAGHDLVFAGAGHDIVFGGAGNDRLYGEDGNDTLMGEDGDDLIGGGAGDDILIAGNGSDSLDGQAGNDTLDGGSGDDRLAGGAGDDVILAGAGDDAVLGGDGNDVLSDGAGRDTVDGGAGDDYLIAAADAADDSYDGGSERDTLDYSATAHGVSVNLATGSAEGAEIGHDSIANIEAVIGGNGDDTLTGSAGDDALAGGQGNDLISDGAGRDIVTAGAGDDTVVAAADGDDDCYDGGDGEDTLDYSTATVSITIDLGSGTAQGSDIGRDLIASFENIIAGSGDDRLTAGSSSVSMTGGHGDDTFEFQRRHDDDDDQAMTVRKITDFTVGDRILTASYEITYRQDDDDDDRISDMFEDIYLSANDDRRPVRFRFEERDQDDFTHVEVHDRPDTDDYYTITLVGHHQLQFTVAVG
jgi:Ca2+-binding RTX toxin-like protein